ncbi:MULTISPECIES: family 43 glycosylhydrolase [unclassified Flavobacterium]|uniref:family 43 glycosylhydrolase n=1 Tax=unclassified Flavobacterium TaxID=196869 RepID=UPI0018E8953F|nr:family 43 glycosylhydrolase [Flavobacterium sp. IB48]MBJ2127254.1 family 43 glycosylhydrolase [Flavobacterium sp. IB48]
MNKLIVLFSFFSISMLAQNPVVPGYFADPSIKKFGDTYYMYSTTDGYYSGNDGEQLVWTTKNFADWDVQTIAGMPHETVWAPAVIQGDNGKYYLYCQSSVDYSGYVYSGDSPTGPFKKEAHLGGFDIEPFRDPVSGKIYVISAGRELFLMDNDVKSPTYLTKIEKKIYIKGNLFDYTEGPYLVYKDGFYYCMWAGGRCWETSYKVRYAVSKNIDGPYEEASNSPILKTDLNAGISGPGHHSITEIDGRSFMFYHRQDLVKGPTCDYRFPAVSEVEFKNGKINLISYVDDLAQALNKKGKYTNLALNKNAFSSSQNAGFEASKAVDGKNDTRWTTGGAPSDITIDLGKEFSFDAVRVCFEYPDKYVTFKIETSTDYQNWQPYADKSQEAVQGFKEMLQQKQAKARYVKVTVNNSEDRNASLWEVQVLKNN